MTRPIKLELTGALYHVTIRSDGQEDIYLSMKSHHGDDSGLF